MPKITPHWKNWFKPNDNKKPSKTKKSSKPYSKTSPDPEKSLKKENSFLREESKPEIDSREVTPSLVKAVTLQTPNAHLPVAVMDKISACHDTLSDIGSVTSEAPDLNDVEDLDFILEEKELAGLKDKRDKPDSALTNKLFSSIIKKTLAVCLPSDLSGVDDLKKQQENTGKKYHALKEAVGKQQKGIDKQRALLRKISAHNKLVSEEQAENLTQAMETLSSLKRDLGIVTEKRKALKSEIFNARHQWNVFQSEAAKLIANLRSLYENKTSDVPIHLSRLSVDTPDGPLVLKDVHLQPKDIRVESKNGKKYVAITLDIPEAKVDIPVEGDVEPVKVAACIKSATLCIDGKVASNFADYIDAPDALSAGFKLVPLIRSIVGLIRSKEEKETSSSEKSEILSKKTKQAPKKLAKLKANLKQAVGAVKTKFSSHLAEEITREDESADSLFPSSIALDIRKVTVDIEHINAKQMAGLYASGNRQPHIQQQALSKLLCLPLSVSIGELDLKTDTAHSYVSDNLDIHTSVKGASVFFNAESPATQGIRDTRQAKVSGKVDSIIVKCGQPLQTISHLGKQLKVHLPDADISFDEVVAPFASDTSHRMEASFKGVELSAAYDFTKVPSGSGNDEFQWLIERASVIQLNAADVEVSSFGEINATGKLSHLAFKKTETDESNAITVSFGNPGSAKKNTLSVNGESDVFNRGSSGFALKGKASLVMEGSGKIHFEQPKNSKDSLSVNVEKLPSIQLHTDEASFVSIGSHHISLPANVNASVEGVTGSVQRYSPADFSDSSASEVSAHVQWKRIALSGQGVCAYQRKGPHVNKEQEVHYQSEINGTMSLTPSALTVRKGTMHNEPVFQIAIEKGGIELNGLSFDRVAIENIHISGNKELNGQAKLRGLSFPLNTLFESRESPLTQFNLPGYARFLLRNKTLVAEASCYMEGGRIDINQAGLAKLRLKPDKQAGWIDRLVTKLINSGLRVASGAFKKKLIQIKCRNGKIALTSSLSRRFNRTLSPERSASITQSLGMDKLGRVHIPSVMQHYTGVSILPAAARETVEYQIERVKKGDASGLNQLAEQASLFLSDPISRTLGLYVLQHFPWNLAIQIVGEGVVSDPVIKQVMALTLEQDETISRGIALYGKLGVTPSEKEARVLFDRCVLLKKDLMPLGIALSTLPDSSPLKALEAECYTLALRHNSNNCLAHAKCARFLYIKNNRTEAEEAKMLEHLREAACLGDKASYLLLNQLVEVSEPAALVMIRVSFYHEMHPNILAENDYGDASEGIPLLSQQHFSNALKQLVYLCDSEVPGIAKAARNILITRCKDASKIPHDWSADHYDKWNNKMRITRKQIVAKEEQDSLWLTTERCFNAALSCLFCLNGQAQDIELAEKLLLRIKDEHEMTPFYLNLIEAIRCSGDGE